MERLTLSRRPTLGNRVECLPAGDGLPVWSKIPLDAKLPMMQNPKGAVTLFTTKLGEPKHRSKQEYTFDLRDPCGKYISNEYQPLHDPHLKSHFSTNVMQRHLFRNGFISEDGNVLCSLREFNQYRQYLRHIFLLEIAKERQEEMENRLKQKNARQEADVEREPSKGTLVRRRLQQQRERDHSQLQAIMSSNTDRLENRLRSIRQEMAARERRQREEAGRRQMTVLKNLRENHRRGEVLQRRWHQRDRMRRRLIADRDTQRRLQTELKCMSTWNARKAAQSAMMLRDQRILEQDDAARADNIAKRDQLTSRQRDLMERKVEKYKQTAREEKLKKEQLYSKRLDEKIAAIERRTKRKGGRRHPKNSFLSTWKLEDVLKSLDVPGISNNERDPSFMAMLKTAIDGAVDTVTGPSLTEDKAIEAKARELVQEVISKVKNDIYPQYLHILGEDDVSESVGNEATKSKSVRFSIEEAAITPGPPAEPVPANGASSESEAPQFKPVAEHVLTPCPSAMEMEAIMGSPTAADKTISLSFVETLLLRLLDDLNSGRLSRDDIMKLATYSMDIISSEVEPCASTHKHDAPEESQSAASALVTESSSSVVAAKMVDFTLSKILNNIQSDAIHPDDLASLTVTFIDNVTGADKDTDSSSEAELDEYIENTIRTATSSATNPREDSPVCDALLDDFMVRTLERLVTDLDNENLTTEQVRQLAVSVQQESKSTVRPGCEDELSAEKENIQVVLQNILGQLHSGSIDFQTLYQTVFAIVYTYKQIKETTSTGYEQRITELLKDLMAAVESKVISGKIVDVNINIVREASNRLSKSALEISQIDQITPSIAVVADIQNIDRDSSSEAARFALESALSQAREKLDADMPDADIQLSVQSVAEAVITVLPERDSPNIVAIFFQLMQALKSHAKEHRGIADISLEDINALTDQIASNALTDTNIMDMALAVVDSVNAPVKSDSSFIANEAVKSSLKDVLKRLTEGAIEAKIIADIVASLQSCCAAADSQVVNSPTFLSSLATLLRTILDSLTYRLQTGELSEDDIGEISATVQNTVLANSKVTSAQTGGQGGTDMPANPPNTHATTSGDKQNASIPPLETVLLLEHIHQLVKTVENGDIAENHARELGMKMIQCGKKILNESEIGTPCTDTSLLADSLVEEVIRTLQIEIESGRIPSESLKEVTKAIISTSTSTTALEAVDTALRSIFRDVEILGCLPSQIDSLPALPSASASTIASYVVAHTIESINKEITTHGIPAHMLSSLASSIVTMLSGNEDLHLPANFQKYRPIIQDIVRSLRNDKLREPCAKEIFSLILTNYKTYVLRPGDDEELLVERLPDDDLRLVNDLVAETLNNVGRSVDKGRMTNKAFSIPSLAHSDDSSVIAERLIDVCIENIQQDLAAEERRLSMPSKDLVEFILEIVTTLEMELAQGSVSNISMAHFYKAISDDQSDIKALEQNAMGNLSRVINDIRTSRGQSVYVHRILNTYLISNPATDGVFEDPLKAIDSILMNVSSDILTKFVKATLQTILMEIRSDYTLLHDRDPSVYVLRSASSVIAENVIKEVIGRIKNDMSKSVYKIHGTVSKRDIERVASRLLSESPKVPTQKDNLDVTGQHSMDSVNLKELEDLLLETLHNTVSNLRLEQSMQPHKPADARDVFEVSQEISDFVFDTLQEIVLDQQDRRSQLDLGVTKTGSKYTGSSIELVSGESKEAATYVNEVLHHVLEEMRQELVVGQPNVSDSGQSADHASSNLQVTIIDSIQRALSYSNISKPHTEALQSYQQEDVRNILINSMNKTIENISSGKFSSTDLIDMHTSCVRALQDQQEAGMDSVTAENVANLMQQVLIKIKGMQLTNDTVNELSMQLATLGMDDQDRQEPQAIHSNSSIASYKINNLITNVIGQIAAQLGELPQFGNSERTTDEQGSESSKKDKNYNRKKSATNSDANSVATESTSSSMGIGQSCPTRISLDIETESNPKKSSNKTIVFSEKKIVKLPSETRPLHTNVRNSDISRTKKSKSISTVSPAKAHGSFAAPRHPAIACYINTKIPRTPKPEKTPTETRHLVKKTASNVRHNIAKTTTTPKKNIKPTKNSNTTKDFAVPAVPNVDGKTAYDAKVNLAGPLELRSLCGSHRAEVHYRKEAEPHAPPLQHHVE